MAFLFDGARLYPQYLGIMTLKELARIASGLPVGARDMRDDIDRHFAALNSYTGKLSGALERLADAQPPDDAVLLSNAITYCGASLLVVASIAAVHGIDLDEAVVAGKHEIQEG
jgi:hypothetical protein